MTKSILPAPVVAVAAVALLCLAGCGGSAKNEQAEAAATIAADSNATMAEANSDVNAAADQAIGGDQPGNSDSDELTGTPDNEIVE